jgi:hypothetical protein
MLEALAQHKTRKVLMDGRKLKGKPRTMERFYQAAVIQPCRILKDYQYWSIY